MHTICPTQRYGIKERDLKVEVTQKKKVLYPQLGMICSKDFDYFSQVLLDIHAKYRKNSKFFEQNFLYKKCFTHMFT